MVTGVPGGRARSALAAGPGSRFADVRWVAETGSTNADAMALARQGAPEGVVVVADHQLAGRGRAGRSWLAPAGANLLASILLRPPSAGAELCTMALGLAASDALTELAGVAVRLKWPNDLVWPGDGSAPDRKLAGILAEADWPAGATPDAGPRPPEPSERIAVVAGIGINLSWPAGLPEELADIAIAADQISPVPVDREDLLVAILEHLGPWYDAIVRSDRGTVLDAWRSRSATLGRRVRVELGAVDVVGTAVDVTEHGHLVVDTLAGDRWALAMGDVTHLRSADYGSS